MSITSCYLVRVCKAVAACIVVISVARSGATTAVDNAASHCYLVVDLSGGCSAARYPIGWLECEPNGGWGDEYKTTMLVLRRIGPGTFIMGEDKTNECHRVTLTRPYYMGVFEVTQRQWELVMGTRPSGFTEEYEKRPVENVSYDMIRGEKLGAEWPKGDDVDADSFLGILRSRTGLNFDLPTEAQWEYACSAGTEFEFSYGRFPDGRYMWYGDNSGEGTHEVGLKPSNKWGLFDMHGNVAEWCLNRNSPLWYGPDPRGFSVGSYRTTRGGNWFSNGKYCKKFTRGRAEPSGKTDLIGFRLMLGLGW